MDHEKMFENFYSVYDNVRQDKDFANSFNEVLSLIFYAYLSDKSENFDFKETDGKIESESYGNLGYFISPINYYGNLITKENNFKSRLDDTLNYISHNSNENSNVFEGIFDICDLNKFDDEFYRIILSELKNMNLTFEGENSYSNLFNFMVEEISKDLGKSDHFSTPLCISKLLSKSVLVNSTGENIDVYDGAIGCGSTLVTLSNENINNINHFYGEDINSEIYQIAKMNLIINGANFRDLNIVNSDSIYNNIFEDLKFDLSISVPPFNLHGGSLMDLSKDVRYQPFAPGRNNLNYGFILNMLSHLKDDGIMGVIMTQNVLFTGANNGRIRKYLIDQHYLDAVIYLPSKLFYNTGIDCVILIFSKSIKNDNVFLIDASKCYTSDNRRFNILSDDNIDLIVNTYSDRINTNISKIVSYEEIENNDYNLSVRRYFNPLKDRNIDFDETINKLNKFNNELVEVQLEIEELYNELNLVKGDDL